MYSKYDNEEFEGYEKTNPSFKDTLIYREVKRQNFILSLYMVICSELTTYVYATGPGAPAEQLGELLHGDLNGHWSPRLHYELHNRKKQEQQARPGLV